MELSTYCCILLFPGKTGIPLAKMALVFCMARSISILCLLGCMYLHAPHGPLFCSSVEFFVFGSLYVVVLDACRA
jgi:hypothetical protein